MECFGPKCVYSLYTTGSAESRLYVGTFSTLGKAIEHALIMKWPAHTWIEELILNAPNTDPVTAWEKPPMPMGVDEARRIWGDAMNLEELKDWLELKNKVDPSSCDPTIPKGATVEIDSATGKAIPRSDY